MNETHKHNNSIDKGARPLPAGSRKPRETNAKQTQTAQIFGESEACSFYFLLAVN